MCYQQEVEMQDYRELSVWDKSHQLVLLTYRATTDAPERKYPGLASQIRRAAASIPANIAEGCGHNTQRELARFLSFALASAFELHYHLQLSLDLGLLSKSDFARLDARTEQVKKMLSSLVSRVRQNADRQENKRAPGPTDARPTSDNR
jgi:four helix bundle protein